MHTSSDFAEGSDGTSLLMIFLTLSDDMIQRCNATLPLPFPVASATSSEPVRLDTSKKTNFSLAEKEALLDWLSYPPNADDYLHGNKSLACRKMETYLFSSRISPSNVIRSWKGIKQHLLTMKEKYLEAKEKKGSTGWGVGLDDVTVEGK
jgi:hypothetical protein